MIDEKRLIERLWEQHKGILANYECYSNAEEVADEICNVVSFVDELSKVGEWIPVCERLPEEHESVFAKAKGTDKWSVGMFEGSSDDVNVTVEFADGTRATKTSHTLDGVWECEKRFTLWEMKVIAWMPLPEPYKGE